jgi:hypothetical protein
MTKETQQFIKYAIIGGFIFFGAVLDKNILLYKARALLFTQPLNRVTEHSAGHFYIIFF